MKNAPTHQLLETTSDWTPIAVSIDAKGPLALHLLELARANRWQLINLTRYIAEIPKDLNLRGAILSWNPTGPQLNDLLRRNLPIVQIGQALGPYEAVQAPTVENDWRTFGAVAAEHFAERGYRHVAYMGNDPWAEFRLLYEGFAAAVRQRDIECHLGRQNMQELRTRVGPGQDLWVVRQQNFTRWLLTLPKPLGLLSHGDLVADLYCQWVSEAGLRVPDDVAVLGVGNNRFLCESAQVPLSAIELDHRRIAQIAVDLLRQLIAGQQHVPAQVLVPPAGVQTRRSTDVLAASDPYVIKALRFVWDHITEIHSVGQVVDHVGVSRRTLERAFMRDLGRGVYQELRNRRLHKARELVAHSDLQVAQIAQQLHFSSSAHFGRAFRQAFGTTPIRYRKRQTS